MGTPLLRILGVAAAMPALLISLLVVPAGSTAADPTATASAASEPQADGSGAIDTALQAAWQRPNISRVPVAGATFNDPSSSKQAAKMRIIDYVDDMIDLTPPGETIRVTQYNLTCKSTVERLVKAYKRGVNVQIVVNDRVLGNETTNRAPYPRFRRLLGTDISKPSFMVVCKRGCRTGGGSALHTKFITISKVSTRKGDRKYLLFTASGNLTCGWAATRQYNDQHLLVKRRVLYDEFNEVFAELAKDKRARPAFKKVTQGGVTAWFFPKPGANRADDPIWQGLKGVKCQGAKVGGGNGKTVVRVKMFTWNGLRGMNLARRLYNLDQQGCQVEVIVGAPAANVLRELRRPGKNGGIKVWDSRTDRNQDGELDLYTHMKMLQIEGRVGNNRSTRYVYTGSANWTPSAYTRGDEVIVRYSQKKTNKQYRQHFNYVKTRSRALQNKPTPIVDIDPYLLVPGGSTVPEPEVEQSTPEPSAEPTDEASPSAEVEATESAEPSPSSEPSPTGEPSPDDEDTTTPEE